MQPPVIFFDIDGTLIDFRTKVPSERTLSTLRALQARGSKIVIATGRAPMLVPEFDGVDFDAFLTFNGSYCYSASDEVLLSVPIPSSAVRKVVENATRIGRPVAAALKDRIVANGADQDMIDFFAISKTPVPYTPDFDEVVENEPVFQFMLGAREPEYEALVAGVPEAKVMAWWHRAADIIPAQSGKAAGVQAICEYFGADPQEAAAFGDGHNDISMLQAVGHSVAMGNASPDVQSAALAVADSVDRDGVYHYCLEQGWIA